MMPLLVFTAICVLAMTGDTIKFGYLPIYMAEQLHVSDSVRGAVIGIQPLLELLMLPAVARLADRYGPLRIMTVGAALGLAGNLAYATSSSVGGLFLGQALTAGLWACVGALGVSIAQQLYPEGGTALRHLPQLYPTRLGHRRHDWRHRCRDHRPSTCLLRPGGPHHARHGRLRRTDRSPQRAHEGLTDREQGTRLRRWSEVRRRRPAYGVIGGHCSTGSCRRRTSGSARRRSSSSASASSLSGWPVCRSGWI